MTETVSNREILFRGRRIVDRVWIEGSLIIDPYGHKGRMSIYYGSESEFSGSDPIDPLTRSQFTGRRADGQRVWEGNTCHIIMNANDYDGVVKFTNGCWMVDCDFVEFELWEVIAAAYKITITGSIHGLDEEMA